MIEHYTEALVLGRRPQAEFDELVTLFTKDLGKVEAFVKSSRRPLSKLSPHLLPGNLVRARLVEKNRLQLADVLGERPKNKSADFLRFLDFLNQVTPWAEPDYPLWQLVKEAAHQGELDEGTYEKTLTVLGFYSDESLCVNCGSGQIVYFITPDVIFLCESCYARLAGSLGKENAVFRFKKK
ncbi:MAG: recombination protein O N-terminal domain-containing protein [Candidatus Colwellbacteria bacterium]|nr:recombination protein O N-terminal domain-containing protein [Candidatus Colwellbacteria bacterium]